MKVMYEFTFKRIIMGTFVFKRISFHPTTTTLLTNTNKHVHLYIKYMYIHMIYIYIYKL